MSQRSQLRKERHAAERNGVSHAIQRTTRQSPYKMRLVIDQIRGKDVNEALGLLKFSKKHAAVQIAKVLNSAVANAEFKSREGNESIDVDTLYIKHAIVNEGPALRRFMPAAQGRATPIRKRTSHVEIVLDAREETRPARSRASSSAAKTASAGPRTGTKKKRSTGEASGSNS
jgi:large subunit ribosomal protein L22